VDWLGDGMRYAVNILALGVLLKGTALLVEELETHQHPESLRKLTQTLFELAKQQELQLFLTTHSEELIVYALDAAKEKDISFKLHHLSLNQEGQLRAIPLDQPTAEVMLDIGHDIRLHEKYLPRV
jgi:AAA15 family ATPase/GTPase